MPHGSKIHSIGHIMKNKHTVNSLSFADIITDTILTTDKNKEGGKKTSWKNYDKAMEKEKCFFKMAGLLLM